MGIVVVTGRDVGTVEARAAAPPCLLPKGTREAESAF